MIFDTWGPAGKNGGACRALEQQSMNVSLYLFLPYRPILLHPPRCFACKPKACKASGKTWPPPRWMCCSSAVETSVLAGCMTQPARQTTQFPGGKQSQNRATDTRITVITGPHSEKEGLLGNGISLPCRKKSWCSAEHCCELYACHGLPWMFPKPSVPLTPFAPRHG